MGLSFGLCGKSTLCIIQGSLWFIVCFLLILYYIIENKNAKLFDREKKKIKEEEEMEKIHVKIAHVSQDLAPSVDAIDTASNLEYWKWFAQEVYTKKAEISSISIHWVYFNIS